MTSEIADKAAQAEARTEETKSRIRQVKRITHRQLTAEKKICIVLEVARYERGPTTPCRRPATVDPVAPRDLLPR
ncbi:MAG: hypothetical protein Q8O76_06940 [Chloroflexota bacterium]|nr:hypothetical protein [Chloroflexota bacterium]